MVDVPQTRLELERHLKEQVAFMRASARAYDAGFTGEAKRLAVVVRVLAHDTNSSVSLLRQLNLKGIPFCDTSYEYDPRKYFLSFHGLAMARVGPSGGEFIPRCAEPPKPFGEPLQFVKFDEWWLKVVVVDTKHNKFTRQALVLTLSNKEGGAHVDPKLDAAYAALTRQNTIGMSYQYNEQAGDISGIELASVRQIAHEVLCSLEKASPEHLS
jgi:hypothetical protein